jgi:hypothetical protein
MPLLGRWNDGYGAKGGPEYGMVVLSCYAAKGSPEQRMIAQQSASILKIDISS